MINKEVVDISENNGILECSISLPVRNHTFPHTMVFRTKDVIRLVTERGYQVDQVLEESFVHNKADRADRYQGTWKFNLKKPKAPKAVPKKRTSKPRPATPTTTKE